MKTSLKPEFVMTAEELADYKALPDNMPKEKLSPRQAQLVKNLYYKYIETEIDNSDWGKELYKVEKAKGWAGRERMSEVEAKRICLNWLTDEQGKNRDLKGLFYLLSCRPAYLRFLSKALEIAE